ncbi:MAG: hypothetical protein ABIH72_04625 [archaeon]
MGEQYLNTGKIFEAVYNIWPRTGKKSPNVNKFLKHSEYVEFLHKGIEFICEKKEITKLHTHLRGIYNIYWKVMMELGTQKDIVPRVAVLMSDYVRRHPDNLELILHGLNDVDKNSRIKDLVVTELSQDPLYRLKLLLGGLGETAGRLKEIAAAPTSQRLALPGPKGYDTPTSYPGSNWENVKCISYAHKLLTNEENVTAIIEVGKKRDKVAESLGMLYKAVNIIFDPELDGQFKGVNRVLRRNNIKTTLNSSEKAARLYVSLLRKHIEEHTANHEIIERGLRELGSYHSTLYQCYKSISIEEKLKEQAAQKEKDKEVDSRFQEKFEKAAARKARKEGKEPSLESLVGLTDEEVELKIQGAVHPYDRMQAMAESKYLDPKKVSEFDYYVAEVINLILTGKKEATQDDRNKGFRQWSKNTYQVILEDHPDYDPVLNQVFTVINDLNTLIENKTLIREEGSEKIRKLLELSQTLMNEKSAEVIIREGEPFICIYTSIESMLQRYKIEGIPLVRVNGEVISEEKWEDFNLSPGDKVEIIKSK